MWFESNCICSSFPLSLSPSLFFASCIPVSHFFFKRLSWLAYMPSHWLLHTDHRTRPSGSAISVLNCFRPPVISMEVYMAYDSLLLRLAAYTSFASPLCIFCSLSVGASHPNSQFYGENTLHTKFSQGIKFILISHLYPCPIILLFRRFQIDIDHKFNSELTKTTIAYGNYITAPYSIVQHPLLNTPRPTRFLHY